MLPGPLSNGGPGPSAAPSAKGVVADTDPTVGCVGEPDQVGAITSHCIATTSSSWPPGTGTWVGAGIDRVVVGVVVASGGVGVGAASVVVVGADWIVVVGIAPAGIGGVCAATGSVAAGTASAAVGADDRVVVESCAFCARSGPSWACPVCPVRPAPSCSSSPSSDPAYSLG